MTKRYITAALQKTGLKYFKLQTLVQRKNVISISIHI